MSKNDSGKLWVKVIIVTFLDAVSNRVFTLIETICLRIGSKCKKCTSG